MSPFVKTGASVTATTIANSLFRIPEDEGNRHYPTEFIGNLTDGYVSVDERPRRVFSRISNSVGSIIEIAGIFLLKFLFLCLRQREILGVF